MSKYIDAEELFKRLNTNKSPAEKTTMRKVTYNSAISDACREIVRMPTADVQEVKHGRWEFVQYGCVCSVCGKRKEQFSDNFCANCGSRMDLDGDAE